MFSLLKKYLLLQAELFPVRFRPLSVPFLLRTSGKAGSEKYGRVRKKETWEEPMFQSSQETKG